MFLGHSESCGRFKLAKVIV